MASGNLMLLAAAVVLAGGFWLLTRRMSAREVTAVASLSALSAGGRVAFAAIPGVQPSTVLICLVGWVLGPSAGFVVGATTALASNVFLGQGPWTIWQMLSWAVIGMVAGWLGKVGLPRPELWLVAFVTFAGFAFGWAMDVWYWLSFVYPHTLASLLLSAAASLPFDAAHAIGNAIFGLLFAPRGLVLLERFRRRSHVVYIPQPDLAEVADVR